MSEGQNNILSNEEKKILFNIVILGIAVLENGQKRDKETSRIFQDETMPKFVRSLDLKFQNESTKK
jgi:hypothetical protein